MSISLENDAEGPSESELCSVIEEMTRSMVSAREVIKTLREKATTTSDLDTRDGISLLSLKNYILLSYLQSLVLLCSRRALGHSLSSRSPPSLPFSSTEREPRGDQIGDLVDSMIEGRVVLEKIKALENRMRYQIEKLVRIAEEDPSSSNQNPIDDPLAFRPNPQNLINNDDNSRDDESDGDAVNSKVDGIYRPPKLAPMPYTEPTSQKSRREPIPSALSSLLHADPTRPHIESTTGLSSMPSFASSRAKEVQRYNEFEEENFTRLVMKKKDAKRRKQDEEDIALGGTGSGGRRRGGGLEDEFGDVIRSVGRGGVGVTGDGYEELRKRGKKGNILGRSRDKTRTREEAFESVDEGRERKKGKFEKEAKAIKKKLAKRRA